MTRDSSSWYNKCNPTFGFYGLDSPSELMTNVINQVASVNPDVIIVNGNYASEVYQALSSDNAS
jgi:hypothetical protein